MKIININSNNLNTRLKSIQKSASTFDPKLVKATDKIVEDVRENGDKALFKYTKKFDRLNLSKSTVKVSANEFKEAEKLVSKSLVSDLKKAAKRIESYQKK